MLTSRNVRGGRFTDIALGGLNYQIEHHLFPSMPTPASAPGPGHRPRRTAPSSASPYHETGLIASWREALRHLHEVGVPLREETGIRS